MRAYSAGQALAMGWLVVLVAWGCGGDSSTNPAPVVLAKAPSQSGDLQTGAPGEALLSALRVLVTSDGIPQSGATVTWTTTDGSVSPTSNVTTADGIGATTWTLGPNAGAQTATATVTGATGSPVTFTATATVSGPPPPDPSQITITVGNNFFTSGRNQTTNPAVDTLAVNGTVTWNWNATAGSHSVESVGTPSFTSSNVLMGPDQSYQFQFTQPGTYSYRCSIHPTIMTGQIVVR